MSRKSTIEYNLFERYDHFILGEEMAIALSHNGSAIALEIAKRDLLRDCPHFRTGAIVILGRSLRSL